MIETLAVVLELIEEQALRVPRAALRPLLVVVSLALATYLPSIAIILMWVAVVRYLPMALYERQGRHWARTAWRRTEQHANALSEALTRSLERSAELEQELERLKANQRSSRSAQGDPLYRKVGLHEAAPDWLIVAARRAYRGRLHPDRHPQHRAQAHDRYLRAEAVFDAIAEQRAAKA